MVEAVLQKAKSFEGGKYFSLVEEQYEKSGCLDFVETCQSHKNREIYERAHQILLNFSDTGVEPELK